MDTRTGTTGAIDVGLFWFIGFKICWFDLVCRF